MIKKILITLLPALFWGIVIKAQASWVTVKVDKQISLRFPSAPVKKPAGAYVYVNKDSTVVLILEIHTQGDSDPAEPVIGEFFEKEDKAKDTSAPVTPTNQTFETGAWNGNQTITSGVVLGEKQLHTYTVIIGNKGYLLGAILTGNDKAKTKDEFFASITINK